MTAGRMNHDMDWDFSSCSRSSKRITARYVSLLRYLTDFVWYSGCRWSDFLPDLK